MGPTPILAGDGQPDKSNVPGVVKGLKQEDVVFVR